MPVDQDAPPSVIALESLPRALAISLPHPLACYLMQV